MLNKLADKGLAIWGFGQEGRAALAAVNRVFPNKPVTVIVRRREVAAVTCELQENGSVTVVADETLLETLGADDIVIKSPGISPYRDEIKAARLKGVKFTSGTRLWFEEHGGGGVACITGTKGKSTTAALVSHLLKSAGRSVVLCGNIGVPLMELIDTNKHPEFWIVELSSYQTQDFDAAPDVAAVLNLFPEHLDWHHSEDVYYRDKLMVLAHPRLGCAVLNARDPRLEPLGKNIERCRYFNVRNGLHVSNDAIHEGDVLLVKRDGIQLKGLHNLSNVCAALTIVKALGVNLESCIDGVGTFCGLAHRLTVLGKRAGITYVDDSISTTPHSTLAAIEAMAGEPLTVLVGGYDRGLDWAPFATAVADGSIHAVVTLPDSGSRIADVFRTAREYKSGSTLEIREAVDLADALTIATEVTPENGTVLLSPGAPSFGHFTDYKERGEMFARLAGFGPMR